MSRTGEGPGKDQEGVTLAGYLWPPLPAGIAEATLPAASERGRADCPHRDIVALYHELLPMCPRIRDWTPARQAQLRARWSEDAGRRTLDYWRRLFAYIAESRFLTGRAPSAGKPPFVASLDWIVKAENFAKIREGATTRRRHERATSAAAVTAGAVPHSIESEQAVLGGLLLDNDAIDRAGWLLPEHFYRADHAAIFRHIVALLADGVGADAVTVFERLAAHGLDAHAGGLAYLNALALQTPGSANIALRGHRARPRAQAATAGGGVGPAGPGGRRRTCARRA